MSSDINLDKYFERIGYDGPATASLSTLRALHKQHAQAIPFENLNPFLGLPVELDPDSLEQKMISNTRGGYCYEQNLLFQHALEAIGFQVKGLSARIRWNKADDEITPRSHMLLLIEVNDDSYVADVGFGNHTLTGPLLLEAGTVQETPHEPRRLVREGKDFVMQTHINNGWRDLYQFDLRENYLADYEVTNWYLSHHPESHFVTGLIAARPAPGRRYTLSDNLFSIHRLNGDTKKVELQTVQELREVLEDTFLLELPEVPALDKILVTILN